MHTYKYYEMRIKHTPSTPEKKSYLHHWTLLCLKFDKIGYLKEKNKLFLPT